MTENASTSTTEFVSLARAAEWFPKRDARKLSVKAIRRRIHTGIRGVRLEARRDGGEWFTCREWVEAFLSALAEASVKPLPSRPPTPAAQSRSRVRTAVSLLMSAGADLRGTLSPDEKGQYDRAIRSKASEFRQRYGPRTRVARLLRDRYGF